MVKHAPAYCRQKRPGKSTLAYVEFDKTRRVYLGEYGCPSRKSHPPPMVGHWSPESDAEAAGSTART